jgi:nucleotide-binding universal stress UspA family protein
MSSERRQQAILPADKELGRNWVVVGVDGSPSADRALRWASDEAAMRQAELEIVCCWPDPSLPVRWAAGGGDLRDLHRRAARRIVDTAARIARCRGYHLEIRPRLVEGLPGPTLAAVSTGASLLVVGRQGINDVVIGSVSSHCLAHAGCPVEVVPCAIHSERRRRSSREPVHSEYRVAGLGITTPEVGPVGVGR